MGQERFGPSPLNTRGATRPAGDLCPPGECGLIIMTPTRNREGRAGGGLHSSFGLLSSLSSAKPICVEFYRRTSPITIVGDHTARWAKQLHAARQCLSGSKLVERSPRHLCSAGYTIFTGLLPDKFLRPTGACRPRRARGTRRGTRVSWRAP
jgi:hypothetical protein